MMSNETDAHGFRSGDATNTSALPTPSLVLSRPVQGTPEAPFEEATLRVCVAEHLDLDPDAEDEFVDVPLSEVEIPVIEFTITREFRAALQSLDNINLVEVFSRRPSGMRTVPTFMRGGFRNCAIQEALSVDQRRSEAHAPL